MAGGTTDGNLNEREKGFSKEKNFRDEFLDGIKYVGKNSWKALPFIGFVNFFGKEANKIIKEYNKKDKSWGKEIALKSLYHGGISFTTGLYTIMALLYGTLKPFEAFANNMKETQLQEQKHQRHIDSTYNSIVNENVDDTTFVNILNKYTPFVEKEKVVNQNSLEEGLIDIGSYEKDSLDWETIEPLTKKEIRKYKREFRKDKK